MHHIYPRRRWLVMYLKTAIETSFPHLYVVGNSAPPLLIVLLGSKVLIYTGLVSGVWWGYENSQYCIGFCCVVS